MMKIRKKKGTKACVMKRKLEFEDYKNCYYRSSSNREKNKIFRKEKMQIVLKKIKKNY